MVFDADDADILDARCAESVIECCRGSVSIIAGSRFLRDQFRPYNANIAIVWTSTYLEKIDGVIPAEMRAPVLTWAWVADHSITSRRQNSSVMLFCSWLGALLFPFIYTALGKIESERWMITSNR